MNPNLLRQFKLFLFAYNGRNLYLNLYQKTPFAILFSIYVTKLNNCKKNKEKPRRMLPYQLCKVAHFEITLKIVFVCYKYTAFNNLYCKHFKQNIFRKDSAPLVYLLIAKKLHFRWYREREYFVYKIRICKMRFQQNVSKSLKFSFKVK